MQSGLKRYKWQIIIAFALLHLALSVVAAIFVSSIGFSRHARGGSYSITDSLIVGLAFIIFFPLGDIAEALPGLGGWILPFILGNSILWGAGLYRCSLLLEARLVRRKRFRERPVISMTVRKALTTIVGCVLFGGAAGSGVGYSIGRFLPGAYRGMFAPVEPDFSPTAVGVGLGLPQGLFFGATIGVVAVAIVTWYEIRIAEAKQGE